MRHPLRDRAFQRWLVPALSVVLVVLVGASGYRLLGGGRWRFEECLYMTVITLSTVRA